MTRVMTENGVDFEFDNNVIIRREGETGSVVGYSKDGLTTLRINGYVIIPKEDCAIMNRSDNKGVCPCLERPTTTPYTEDPAVEGLTSWPDPTAEQIASPEFEAVWQVIKKWDIERLAGDGYCGATGNHVVAILTALRPFLD